MAAPFKKGDQVEWSVGTGKATGTVQKKVTQETDLNGQRVDASAEDPRYFVKNDNTGNVTSHKPESLSLKADSDHELQKGDRVEWNTAQGKTTGTIEKKLTNPTQIKDYDVKASDKDPQYLVKSEKTGAKAAHKPDALEKK